MKSSRSEFIPIRGLRYHVRHWGDADAPMLFMLHGWMDVSASFQFLVDAMQRDWHVVAPDWRGFGLTDYAHSHYWFPDYLADLEALLQHYSPGQPVNLLGHSLGANVAGIYAGVRPSRVSKLILVEGLGRPVTPAEEAPARYAQWLDEQQQAPHLRAYASQAEVAVRLQKTNPRLNDERAAFLAAHWAAPDGSGKWKILADSFHRRVNPVRYRIDEVLACWELITASVLWIEAIDSAMFTRMGTKDVARAEIDRRIAHFHDLTTLRVANAGHMVQHDQPEIVAHALEQFLN